MPTFMKYVGDIWRCTNLNRALEYEPLGIGCYQDSYIIHICKHPGLTQEQLSKLIYVHKSNVTRQLMILEEKGFVYRRNHKEDKRIQLVYPTQKAWDVLPLIHQTHEAWNKRVLEGISEEDQQLFFEVLERISENAKKSLEEGNHRS